MDTIFIVRHDTTSIAVVETAHPRRIQVVRFGIGSDAINHRLSVPCPAANIEKGWVPASPQKVCVLSHKIG